MATLQLGSVDERRLHAIEFAAAPLSEAALPADPTGVPGVLRYLEHLPPRTALALIAEVRALRLALEEAVGVLEQAGFTPDAYLELDEKERAAPAWQAVRKLWETCGIGRAGEKYVLRYTWGSVRGVRAFATREAALAAAIEALEMNEAYPEAIEAEGVCLMDTAAIVQAWEDRHDPG